MQVLLQKLRIGISLLVLPAVLAAEVQ